MAESLDLYVSPAGNDAWSGRHPEPTGDGGDGPFATLEAARDALRERRRSGATGGSTVWLRGWSYQREATFELGSEDGRSEDAPVVYRAFPGEVRPIGDVIVNNLCYGGRWLLTLRVVDPRLLPDDGNLIGVDPGFADEPNDLLLATGSLAYEAGMQAVPFDRIGPAASIGPNVHNES